MNIKQIIREEIDSDWGFMDDVDTELTLEGLKHILRDSEIVVTATSGTIYHIINSSETKSDYGEVTIYTKNTDVYDDREFNYYGGYDHKQVLGYIKDKLNAWTIIEIIPLGNHSSGVENLDI